jgi:hypothetical protein
MPIMHSKLIKKLAPLHQPSKSRLQSLGRDRGKFVVSEDFNDPLPADIYQAFESGAE